MLYIMRRTQLYLDDDLWSALHAHAQREHTTISQLVRDAARDRYQQALPLYQQVGDILGEANCIACLGDVALRSSDLDTARGYYQQALPLLQRVESVIGQANCLLGLG